ATEVFAQQRAGVDAVARPLRDRGERAYAPCNRAHRERQHDREPVPYTATGRGSGTRPRISSNEATSGPGTESPTATNRRNWFKAGAIGKDAGRAGSPRSEPAWCARLSDFCDLPGARSAWWRDLMP